MIGFGRVISALITLLPTWLALLVLTWLVLLVLLVASRPTDVNTREERAFVPDLVGVNRLASDASLGNVTSVRLPLLLAHLAFPITLCLTSFPYSATPTT